MSLEVLREVWIYEFKAGDLLSWVVLREPGCAMETAFANSPGYEVSGAVMNNSNDQVCVLGHSS